MEKEQLVDVVLLLSAKVQQLSDTVRDLVTSKYGPKTERFQDPDQLHIFPTAAQADGETGQKTDSANASPKESKPGHSRNPFPDHLPRITIEGQLAESEKNCTCCGRFMEVVRKVHQGSRLQYTPASFHVEEMMAQIYSCPDCKNEEKIARVPEPVKNGLAGSGLLSQVAVSKGTDHLPFNRQSSIYARSGVQLSRSTLSDLFAHSAEILLPLYDYMHQQILSSHVICTDDSPVKVKDHSKENNIKTGRIWIYLGDSEHPFNLFDYTTGRGRDGPLKFLEGFNGYLQGDCFSGNLAVCAAIGTVLVACLAHARRYFVKAMLNDSAACNHALTTFQALYEIERTAKELKLNAPELKSMRKEEAIPILKEFRKWIDQQYQAALPKSSFGKALFYCLNNWDELTQYVTDGALSIDNNISEREMKYVAMGRKAWLFLGSDTGGKNHAVILSLLSTCRRHGVEPWAYLTDVIARTTDGSPQNLEELLPHKWKPSSPQHVPAEIPAFSPAPKNTLLDVDRREAGIIPVLQNAI